MKKPQDPTLASYVVTLNSPQAEKMVTDLVEKYILARAGEDVIAFNAKRELVVEILSLAQVPMTPLVLSGIAEG